MQRNRNPHPVLTYRDLETNRKTVVEFPQHQADPFQMLQRVWDKLTKESNDANIRERS